MMHDVATKLREIETQLNAFYLERREVIRAMLLAVLAKEHAFILGPPGTGKTQLVKALISAFTGARYFECALSKTRPSEAVLGPLNIKEFRDNGNYYLKREGFASAVEFALLDEGGKMSPVLGHDLLALLNERVYHEVNGGRSVHPAPLYSAFVPSNEHITGESDDAAALWDRLLVRTYVDYLQDKSNFAALLDSGAADKPSTQIPFEELQKAIDVEVPSIPLDQEALKAIIKLRSHLAAEHIVPSDRRWKWSMKVLRANAFLEGRDRIIEDDLAALRFTLWDTVEQIEKVERMCLSASNPFVEELLKLRSQLVELNDGVASRANEEESKRLLYGKEANTKLKAVRDGLDRMLKTAGDKAIPGFPEVAALHEKVLTDNYHVCLGLDEDAAQIAASKKLGLGTGEH